MLERVIEEQARGDAAKALDAIRKMIVGVIGSDLSKIVPGSDAAMRLKAHLIDQGRLVPISGGRHRPRRRDLHQGRRRCPQSAPAP